MAVHRPGDRRDRDPHVHADLRAGGEPAMIDATRRSPQRARRPRRAPPRGRRARGEARARARRVRRAPRGDVPPRRAAHGRAAPPRARVRPRALQRVLAQRLRRCCAPRAATLLLATDDPFAAEQAAWAAERIRAPFTWRLVHRGDLVGLSREPRGDAARARRGARRGRRRGRRRTSGARGPLARRRSATRRARWCAWCARRCATRSRSARATSTSRPSPRAWRSSSASTAS